MGSGDFRKGFALGAGVFAGVLVIAVVFSFVPGVKKRA